MNQYLSPFQQLINNFDIGNNLYNEISNGLDPSPLELFLDTLLNVILSIKYLEYFGAIGKCISSNNRFHIGQ